MRCWQTLVLIAACGGGHAAGDDATGDGGGVVDAGPVSSCDPPGKFGVPTTMFTLPAGALTYEDVQAAFPQVDWQQLDRLYLPAGVYAQIMLGNLPERTADHPLVITNLGGQVQIGPAPTANYIWSFTGGSNWILTGRFDPISLTGDAAFPGHACGNYATSAGHYGLLSDDAFALAAPYLHMGIAVTDASDFEIEYVEVKRSGFAGIRLINEVDQGVTRPMANVRVHDTYVHDTGGEGYYFGWTGAPPSTLMPGLQIYNNRLIRTGNEALQIQDLGDGTHVHHNAMISGGLHWLDNGLGHYQDNNSQMLVRSGAIEIDHNLFVDGAGTLINFFSSPEAGDGDRHVAFHDNYFADALSLGLFLNGTSTPGSSFDFTNNTFAGLVFGYTPADPAATDPGVIFGRADAMMAPINFTTNRWEGADQLANGLTGGDGTSGPYTATGNLNGPVPELAFANETAGHHITAWVATVTVSDPQHAMTFHAGDVVTYGDAPDLYVATGDASGTPPPQAPAQWMKLPPPDDDVRVTSSDYPGVGVQ
jgi:hypothetical protein